MLKIIFVVSYLIYLVQCNERYDFSGYKVYRLNPQTEEQNGVLDALAQEETLFDFWTDVNKAGIPVDVMVPPDLQEDFMILLEENKIDNHVMIDDIEGEIDNEIVQSNARGDLSWTSYHKLEDIYAWMDNLETTHPNVASVVKAGTTYQGRDIKAIKISYGEDDGDQKRAVFLEGGIHAREWISPATVTYIINELLNSDDPAVREIAESFDWYIVPVTNPDGYVFTHQYHRLWRKTRSGFFIGCKGVDANRNWDFQWGKAGTSKNRCAETYGGPNAFSEKETSSLSEFISTIGHDLDVYLAFHSYSQLMLMPYGHTEEHLDNYEDVLDIGQKAATALEQRYGTKYKVGNIAETIYKASGSSMDWVKATFHVPIAYTYELRDTGKHGFILPAEQIIPNCEEVMDSFVTIFQQGASKGIIRMKRKNNTNRH